MAAPPIASRDFMDTITSFLGVPVHGMGKSRNGVDCRGLIVAAVGENGETVDSDIIYGPYVLGDFIEAEISGFCEETDTIARGVIIQLYYGREPRHLAVITRQNSVGQWLMIHASPKKRQVIEELVPLRYYKLWKLNLVDYDS